jgi:tetratricopeptide (TPR) repeat protein
MLIKNGIDSLDDNKQQDIYRRIGFIYIDQGKVNDAIKFLEIAIRDNPNDLQLLCNLAMLNLDAEKKIVEEMNKLGISAKDIKRYDELKKQRIDMFNSALPYLEKAYELSPENEYVKSGLRSAYIWLEKTDKYKALKAKM